MVVAEIQQLQASHPQCTDGDGDEPVLRDVQVDQLLQAAELWTEINPLSRPELIGRTVQTPVSSPQTAAHTGYGFLPVPVSPASRILQAPEEL